MTLKCRPSMVYSIHGPLAENDTPLLAHAQAAFMMRKCVRASVMAHLASVTTKPPQALQMILQCCMLGKLTDKSTAADFLNDDPLEGLCIVLAHIQECCIATHLQKHSTGRICLMLLSEGR